MKKFIATIVYTHLWIAICAAAMVLQTSYLLTESWVLTPLTYLTFGSTLFIYTIHRLVGLQKLKDLNVSLNPRYIIIDRDQRMVLLFGIIGGLITLYYFFQLQRSTQLWLILPGLISLAYVIPFLSGNRRLRDIGLIKIFLIAIAYAMITVQLVLVQEGLSSNLSSSILFVEKALFIFAITLPFDIRDLEVDKVSGVITIPQLLGKQRAIWLALFCILLCMILVYVNNLYRANSTLAMLFSYCFTIYYLYRTEAKRTDLFYSFGMDGMMVIQTLFLFVVSLTSF